MEIDDVSDLVSAIELLNEDEVGAALGMSVTAGPVPEITVIPSTTTMASGRC